jgi:DNA topoisomerase IA
LILSGYLDHFHFDGIGQVTLTITINNHKFRLLLEAIKDSGWLKLDKYFDEFGLADSPQSKEIPVHMAMQLVKQLKDREF